MEKRFELRQSDRVFARLTVSEIGEVALSHDLTEDELSRLPEVMPFDEAGAQLKVYHREGKIVAFSDNAGLLQLGLDEDEDGFLTVRDTKNLARLRIKLTGSGSIGEQPAHHGYLVLQLVPLKSKNK